MDNLLIKDRRPTKSDDNSSNGTFRPDEIKHLWQIIIYNINEYLIHNYILYVEQV